MIRCAVVGLGWWGRTIVETLAGSARLTVRAAVDVNPEAAETARRLGIAFASDFAQVLGDPGIDAVVLCTPHSQHSRQIRQAAAAGKHVFCEKPLALTRADAEQAIAACNACHVVLGVGHERRFEPPVVALKRLVDAGELGTLLQIEANFSQDRFLALPAGNWRLSEAEAPAGPMTATGIHLLDLAVGFLGPAERVLVKVGQLGSELANGDTFGALVMFRSGANALISAMLATAFDGRFAVYGNRGWVEIRDKAHPERPQGWTVTTSLRGGDRQTVDRPPASAVRANLEAFAAAAAGRAPYPYPQREMIETISALEAIVRSARSRAIEAVER